MPFKLANNVHETSTTTGTGTLTLAGAISGALAFSSQLASGDTTYYAIYDGTNFEVGLGTYTNTSGQQLSRDTVYYSSTGSKVNWAAGTRNVVCGLPAEIATKIARQFSFGTHTFSSVLDNNIDRTDTIAHGLETDDIDIGACLYGGASGDTLAGARNAVYGQIMAPDSAFTDFGASGYVVGASNLLIGLPAAGYIAIGVKNTSGVTQDVTVRWWARARV